MEAVYHKGVNCSNILTDYNKHIGGLNLLYNILGGQKSMTMAFKLGYKSSGIPPTQIKRELVYNRILY